MIVYLTRFILIVAGAIGGFAVSDVVDWSSRTGLSQDFVIFIFVILGSSIGYVLGGILGRELALMWAKLEDRVRFVAPADLLLGTAGLLIGLLIALLVSVPLRIIEPAWLALVASVLLFIMFAYAGVRIALVKRNDLTGVLSKALGRAPEKAVVPTDDRPVVLDTSAIIDARFAELARLGFLRGSLRVPRFVLGELHTLADSADDTKRARGRRGLDLLETLPGKGLSISTFEADFVDIAAVDEKLVRLASQLHAALVTVDFNLTKVARVEGVEVLNINELAASLRPAFLPGESLHVRVAREGREADQGVGYLEDGTMVVIQNGRELIGEDVDTEVTSVLQTSAGRMIFARAHAGTAEGRP